MSIGTVTEGASSKEAQSLGRGSPLQETHDCIKKDITTQAEERFVKPQSVLLNDCIYTLHTASSLLRFDRVWPSNYNGQLSGPSN